MANLTLDQLVNVNPFNPKSEAPKQSFTVLQQPQPSSTQTSQPVAILGDTLVTTPENASSLGKTTTIDGKTYDVKTASPDFWKNVNDMPQEVYITSQGQQVGVGPAVGTLVISENVTEKPTSTLISTGDNPYTQYKKGLITKQEYIKIVTERNKQINLSKDFERIAEQEHVRKGLEPAEKVESFIGSKTRFLESNEGENWFFRGTKSFGRAIRSLATGTVTAPIVYGTVGESIWHTPKKEVVDIFKTGGKEMVSEIKKIPSEARKDPVTATGTSLGYLGAFLLPMKVRIKIPLPKRSKTVEVLGMGSEEIRLKGTIRQMPEEYLSTKSTYITKILEKSQNLEHIPKKELSSLTNVIERGKTIRVTETGVTIKKLGDTYVAYAEKPTGLETSKVGDLNLMKRYQKITGGKFTGLDVIVEKNVKTPVKLVQRTDESFKPVRVKPEKPKPVSLKQRLENLRKNQNPYFIIERNVVYPKSLYKLLGDKFKGFVRGRPIKQSEIPPKMEIPKQFKKTPRGKITKPEYILGIKQMPYQESEIISSTLSIPIRTPRSMSFRLIPQLMQMPRFSSRTHPFQQLILRQQFIPRQQPIRIIKRTPIQIQIPKLIQTPIQKRIQITQLLPPTTEIIPRPSPKTLRTRVPMPFFFGFPNFPMPKSKYKNENVDFLNELKVGMRALSKGLRL